MMMSEPVENNYWMKPDYPPMSSAEDSHVKTSALLEDIELKDLKENNQVSGRTTRKSSKKSNPNGSSLKTPLDFAISDWKQYFRSSMRSGMMLSGTVYTLNPLVLITRGTGYLSLPTP